MKLGSTLLKTSTMKWREIASDKTFQYIDLTSINRQTHKIVGASSINAQNAPSRAQKIIKAGDVLFGTTRPTLNRLCIVPDNYDNQICSTGLCVLRANEELILPGYIYYLLNTTEFVSYVEANQRGTSYPAVTDSDVKNFDVKLPSLKEQEEIVTKLDAAHEKISKAEALMKRNIDNVSLLQKSILSKYLGGAKGTHTHRLAEVCEIVSKLVDPRVMPYVEQYHIGAANIESGTGVLVDLQTAKQEKLISGKFPFTSGMVLYSKIRPYLKKAARPDFDGICSADIYPLAPKGNITRDYLYYLLMSDDFTSYAVAGSQRAGMPKVNREHLFAYSCELPNVEEQEIATKQIDSMAMICRNLLDRYSHKLEKLTSLRRSLLAEAFTTTALL